MIILVCVLIAHGCANHARLTPRACLRRAGMSSDVQASIWRALPVWVWFDYAEEPARYIQLNLRALQRHAPSSHFSIHFVNRSNIASFVPDLNEAFWRLSKHVALRM